MSPSEDSDPHRAITLSDRITPFSPLWKPFLTASITYIITEWPSILESETLESFQKNYERDLRRRIEEGGRYLHFFHSSESNSPDNRIGLVNLYTTSSPTTKESSPSSTATLNIAEFSVFVRHRRQGWGRTCVEAIRSKAVELGCASLIAEVDLDLPRAIAFWSATMGSPIRTDERHLFWIDL